MEQERPDTEGRTFGDSGREAASPRDSGVTSHGQSAESARSRSILRFAVAMRGGVSLAVWIGGALSEIDRLRRNESDDCLANALLEATGFERLEVDILTGASAGGLNAAVGGTAIVRGAKVNSLRPVWMDSAAIDDLLEAHVEGGSANRHSVLNGDYFMGEVRAQLSKLIRELENPVRRPVEIFLAATVFRGIRVTSSADPTFSDHRREAFFHFRHLANAPPLSDFANRPDLVNGLSQAARSSASFPGAFDPVLVEPADLRGRLRLPAAAEPSTLRLYDGGIVDNIPVARAIRAAAASPAQDTVRRWVVFLHPSPSVMPALTQSNADSVPTVVDVVKDVLGGRGVETLLDDLDVLRENNRASLSHKLVRVSLCRAAFAARGGQLQPSLAETTSASEDMASADVDRLYALLDDPTNCLGWIPIGTSPPQSPIASRDDESRYQLRMSLLANLLERPGTVRPFARIVRLAHLVIEWIRWVERNSDASTEEWRRLTYDALLVAQLLDAGLDRTFLTTASESRLDELINKLQEVRSSTALHDLVGALGSPGSVRADAPRLPLWDRLSRDDDRDTLGELANGHLPVGQQNRRLRPLDEVLLHRLCEVGVELSRSSTTTHHAPESIFTVLREQLGDTPSASAVRGALLVADSACVGLHRGRAIGAPISLDYQRISGAAPSPLAPGGSLHSDVLERFTKIIQNGGQIAPDSKLSGNALANLSAFISKRFRANDWMWGRMDAAAGLVNILIRSGLHRSDPGGRLDSVRKIVTARFGDGVRSAELRRSGEQLCEALWAEHSDSVKSELLSLGDIADSADLPHTSELITARWQLEIFLSEAPEVLAENVHPGDNPEPPLRLNSPGGARGEGLEVAKRNIRYVMTRYEKSPRRVTDIWGQRKTAALGVRSARWTARALVPGPGPARLLLRTIASVPLFIATAAVLLPTQFLIAWSLLLNGVLAPRLTLTAAVVIVAVSAAAATVFWRGLVKRKDGGLGQWLVLGAALALHAWGLLSALVDRVVFGPPPAFFGSTPWPPPAQRGETLGKAIAVAVVVAIASALLWWWAKRRWIAGVGLVAGLVMGWWALLAAWQPTGDVLWVSSAQKRIASIWIPAGLLVLVTSVIAVLARPENRRLPNGQSEETANPNGRHYMASTEQFTKIFTGGDESDKIIKAGTLFITRGAGAIAIGLVGIFYGLDQFFSKGPWVDLRGAEKLRFVAAVGLIWAIVAAADAIARGISTGLTNSREPLVVLEPPIDGSFKQPDGHSESVKVRAVRLASGDTTKFASYLISYDSGVTAWKTKDVTLGKAEGA